MDILTIFKAFGLKSSLKFNRHRPKLRKIKAFLIENGLCNRTIASVIRKILQKKSAITIRKKHPRSRNGDIITNYLDLKQLSKKDLNQSRKEPEIKQNDGEIEVFRCQFMRTGFINSIKGLKSIVIRLENGEMKELYGKQRTINQLPIFKSGSELIIHYRNDWDWAIDNPQILNTIKDSISNS